MGVAVQALRSVLSQPQLLHPLVNAPCIGHQRSAQLKYGVRQPNFLPILEFTACNVMLHQLLDHFRIAVHGRNHDLAGSLHL